MTTYIQPGVQISESARSVPGGTFSGNRRIGIIAKGNPSKTTYDQPITRYSVEPDSGKIFVRDVTPVLNGFTITPTNIVRYITNIIGFDIVFTSAYDTAIANIINSSTTYYATLNEETGQYSVSTTEGSVEGSEETGSLEVVAVLGTGGTVGEGEIDIKTILQADYDSSVTNWLNALCQQEVYVTVENNVFRGNASWNTENSFYLTNMSGDFEGYAIVASGETGSLVVVANPSTDTDTIPNVTAENLNEVISVGTLPGMSDFIQYVDDETVYDYKIVDNTIEWAGGARRPTDGSTYYITYSETKDSSYYKPITYYSFEEMENIHGDIYYNGVLINAMLLCAKIAFLNGATEIITRQLHEQNGYVTNAEIDEALDDMGAVDFEILLTPFIINKDSDIMTRLQQLNTPQIKKERLWLAGIEANATPAVVKTRANSMSSSKYITLIAPKGNVVLTDMATQTDVTVDVPGDYFGAALAGLMCNPNNDKANPITNQAVAGISYPANMPATPIWTDTVMNDMASNGVLLMYNDNGVTRVRHALTTNTTNQILQELQVRWISVLTIKELRLQLKPYIGMKATQKVVNFVKTTIQSYLDQGIKDEVYTAYRNLTVALSSTDIRTIECSMDIQPVGTLTWITVDFGFVVN